jgi:Mlc titration factor MtfA (ptsG expression regulator)
MRRSRRGLPEDAEHTIERELAHWAVLDDAERARLLELTDWILRRKHWEAAGGFELTDTIRLVIAVQAALLILGLTPDHYRLVSSVIVYPSTAITTGERAGPVPGTRTDEPLAIHGLAQDRRGPVLVAWDQAQESARHPERGHNVVIHEFAHKLDMLDGIVDGTPPITDAAMKPWVTICTEVFDDLRAGRARPPLRPYGATNPAEFFAVVTETFFDRPIDLRLTHPELYEQLQRYYDQDPASLPGLASP